MHDPTDHGRVRSEPEDLAIPDPRGLQSHGLGEVRVGIVGSIRVLVSLSIKRFQGRTSSLELAVMQRVLQRSMFPI